MYIAKIESYIPENIIDNQYFEVINGLKDDWIVSRTGIKERRKLSEGENTNTITVKAVEKLIEKDFPIPIEEIDLIVGATYTPYDTIHTLAHATQKLLDISDIPVISLSTACSSFVNAMELVEGYFAMGKSEKALVMVADHNTHYSNDNDKVGGHLWGDGAAALLVTKEKINEAALKIIDIKTGGAGNVGKADEGVFLRIGTEGFKMLHGRDVFLNACQYMYKVTNEILEKNNYEAKDLKYFIPHQANYRITKNVAENLGLPLEQALSNIQYLGNTGCAGSSIALYENLENFEKGDLLAVTVFGGGYSYGCMLLEV